MTENRQQNEDLRAAALLRRLPDHAPGAPQRVRVRLDRTAALPVRTPWWVLLGAGVGGGVVVTAAAMLVLLAPDEILPSPSDPVAPLAAAPVAPTPIAATLASADTWSMDTSLDGVQLSYQGTGEIVGTGQKPRIRWELGTLHVEVEPDRGIKLAVETKDAEVRVVGTGFSVSRDALGTRVEVRHGKVEVDCGDEPTLPLEAGGTKVCLPRAAGALLGRARALQLSGSSAEALDAVDRGLAVAGGGTPMQHELLAVRVGVLVELGRRAEALESARLCLDSGHTTRRSDVVTLAVAAARAEGGCAVAAPWLAEADPTAAQGCRAR